MCTNRVAKYPNFNGYNFKYSSVTPLLYFSVNAFSELFPGKVGHFIIYITVIYLSTVVNMLYAVEFAVLRVLLGHLKDRGRRKFSLMKFFFLL